MDIDSGHSQHQDNRLYPAFVNSRLDIGGRERYDIQGISDVVPKSSHVTRQLMSKLYGGSPQGMFPTIHCSKLKDGVDNLGFINRDLNPYAPVLRGETGLFFFLNPQWIGQVPKRLFIRQTSSQWLYFGLYKFITAMPLTAAEFRLLEPKIQLGWVKHLFSKQWGRQFLVRIALRDENGGEEPSEEDIAAILGDKNTSKTYADKKRVTVEQVLRAFLSGKERLRVSCLKCIGYDLNWQKNLTEQSRQFDEENKARKAAKPHVPQEADPDAESEPVVPLPRAHGLPPKDTCKTQAGQQHTPLRPQGAEIWREVTIPQSARRELAVPQPARRKLAVPRPGSSGFPLLSNSHVQHSRSSRTPYSTAAIRARNSEYTAFAEISEQESADESDEIDKTQASSRHPPTKSRRPQELEAQRGLTALPTAWRESAASQPVRRKLAVPRSRSPGAPEHPWASTSNVQPLSRRELESKATRALALAGFGSDLSDLSELESADETDGGDENDVIVPDNSDVHDFDEDEAEEAMVKRLLGL
ncbi:hypothetical protein BC835DRAFT_1511374 [Cytidiella melzeri]|nr:hypothetical protein BC835DRAFT_1511374 [Cytidiella melzeri]